MILSYLMTEILLGWTRKSRNWFMKRKAFSIFFCQNNNDKHLLDRLKHLQAQLNFLIQKSKGKYNSRLTSKFSGIGKSSKVIGLFWKVSLLAKKIPCIPPLFENNEYYRFQEKSRTIQLIFWKPQCSLINNNSQFPWTLSYKINERLSSVKATDGDIQRRIAKLDPNKVHGHDKTSIRMILICSTSICKPLRLIFNHCVGNGIYPC